jgi:hypothetical protein
MTRRHLGTEARPLCGIRLPATDVVDNQRPSCLRCYLWEKWQRGVSLAAIAGHPHLEAWVERRLRTISIARRSRDTAEEAATRALAAALGVEEP